MLYRCITPMPLIRCFGAWERRGEGGVTVEVYRTVRRVEDLLLLRGVGGHTPSRSGGAGVGRGGRRH